MESNLPPFYVGQKVECIIAHSFGVLKKGDCYTVTSIRKSCCGYVITVGIISPDKNGCYCEDCGKHVPEPNGEWAFNAGLFRPIQEQNFPLITLSKIQEKEREKIEVKEYEKQLIGNN